MNLNDFGLQGGARKTLVILGAGATRGASFVDDPSGVLPPLDRDFFQQLTRLDQTRESRRLLEFIRSEYGHELGLSMERFFSEADYTDRFHRDLNVDPGPIVKRYRLALQDFYHALPRLLDVSTAASCVFHGQLASLLHTQDCVLSFNYDCVMDGALRDRAGRRWDPDKDGYAFPVIAGGPDWRTHGSGSDVSGSIRLLKMHGSLNWNLTTGGVELVRPTTLRTADKAIIPPTWFKDLARLPFASVWKAARKELRSSRIIVVIGYSVPDTDLFTRSLLKVEAGSKGKRERLDLLVLVNPDEDAKRRFLGLIEGALELRTRILTFDSFRALHQLWERSHLGRASAAVPKPTAAFMAPLVPDEALAAIVGGGPQSRTEITKRLWNYIKKNGLQDQKDKRMINADALLSRALAGRRRVSMFELTKYVSGHLTGAPEPVDPS